MAFLSSTEKHSHGCSWLCIIWTFSEQTSAASFRLRSNQKAFFVGLHIMVETTGKKAFVRHWGENRKQTESTVCSLHDLRLRKYTNGFLRVMFAYSQRHRAANSDKFILKVLVYRERQQLSKTGAGDISNHIWRFFLPFQPDCKNAIILLCVVN